MIAFLATVLLWLLPGIGLARLLGLLSRRDLAAAGAVSVLMAVAVSTLGGFLALTLGATSSFHVQLVGLGVLGLGAWFLPRRRVQNGTTPPAPPTVQAISIASLILLAALGAWVGASLRVTGDALDHIATLREIRATGLFFPTDTLHLDAGLLGSDPRKGLLHPVYAGLSRLAGLDPVEFWRYLPTITAPLVFLGGYGFLRWFGASAAWSLLGGWLLVLTRSGGPGVDLIGIAPYPNQVGAALFWMTAGLTARALGSPRTVLKLSAALGAFAAVAVHPMYLVFVALLYLVLGLHSLLFRQRARLLRLLATGLGFTVLTAFYLFHRFAHFAPANPIHTERQGMLLLSDRWFVADPGRLMADAGAVTLLAYLFSLLFLRNLRREPAAFFAVASVLLMAFVTLNPLLVPFLQGKLTYLVFRSFWFLPPALAAGILLPRLLGTEARSPEESGPRLARAFTFRAATGLVLLAVLIVPSLRTLPTWTERSPQRDGSRDPLSLRRDLVRLAGAIPDRSVILSDPITSYLLPAFTDLKVVAPFDQHSSPNDSLALSRILAARDVLLVRTPLPDALAGSRGTGAGYVLVNTGSLTGVPSHFWAVDSGALAERGRQLARSSCFEPAGSAGRLHLFRVREETPCRMDGKAFHENRVRPAPEGSPLVESGGVILYEARALSREIARGETVLVHLLWGVAGDPSPATLASIRLDALDAPGGSGAGSKPWRKLAELRHGGTYRAREDWKPTGGAHPPDHWIRGEAVADTAVLTLPQDLVPGRYAVTVAVNRMPFMPNHRVRDYLDDRDLYSGPAVDTVTVVAGP